MLAQQSPAQEVHLHELNEVQVKILKRLVEKDALWKAEPKLLRVFGLPDTQGDLQALLQKHTTSN